MSKYIFHMANGTKKEVEAEDLTRALKDIAFTGKPPIGTRDGKSTTIVYIEVESEGKKWTIGNENDK